MRAVQTDPEQSNGLPDQGMWSGIGQCQDQPQERLTTQTTKSLEVIAPCLRRSGSCRPRGVGPYVIHIAFHSEPSRRGRRNELGSCAVRSICLRRRPDHTGSEIGHARECTGAGPPRVGAGEPARSKGATPCGGPRRPGIRSQGEGRYAGKAPAKTAYRELPAAPTDLCAAKVRRSCCACACASDRPIAGIVAARGGLPRACRRARTRRLESARYLSTSDRSSRQTPRPWVAA